MQHQEKICKGLVVVDAHTMEKTHKWTKNKDPYLDCVYDLGKCAELAVFKPYYQKIAGDRMIYYVKVDVPIAREEKKNKLYCSVITAIVTKEVSNKHFCPNFPSNFNFKCVFGVRIGVMDYICCRIAINIWYVIQNRGRFHFLFGCI